MTVNRKNGLLAGMIAGVVVGTALGMLLAPRPGKATREEVGARASEFQQRTGQYLNQLRSRFRQEEAPDAVVSEVNHS